MRLAGSSLLIDSLFVQPLFILLTTTADSKFQSNHRRPAGLDPPGHFCFDLPGILGLFTRRKLLPSLLFGDVGLLIGESRVTVLPATGY